MWEACGEGGVGSQAESGANHLKKYEEMPCFTGSQGRPLLRGCS